MVIILLIPQVILFGELVGRSCGKCLKQPEAWTITKKYDKYAEQLAQIEVLIRDEAERGGACTWWYCENMINYERKILVKRLDTITVDMDTIYINWRDASKE
jgi:hypothetical protein